ncbi:MAG: hypothetical protein M3Q80_02650 [bacterium]|nr:hypothetical protein [bacterium]
MIQLNYKKYTDMHEIHQLFTKYSKRYSNWHLSDHHAPIHWSAFIAYTVLLTAGIQQGILNRAEASQSYEQVQLEAPMIIQENPVYLEESEGSIPTDTTVISEEIEGETTVGEGL